MLYLCIAAILICETMALTFLKYYSQSGHWWQFAAAVLSYVGVCIALVFSFRYEALGIVNVLWSILSIMCVITVGMVFFKESLQPLDMVGVVLAVAAIALLRLHA